MQKWTLAAAAVVALLLVARFTLFGSDRRHGAAARPADTAALAGPSSAVGAQLEHGVAPEARGARAALDGAAAVVRAADDGGRTSDPDVGSLVVEVQRADGAPVADMALFIEAQSDEHTTRTERLRTDTTGRARAAALAPGPYSVSSVRGPSGEVTVRAAEEAQLVLKLKGAVDVRGVVVAPDGRPIAGAEVWLLTLQRDWRGKERIAVSDARGAFEARDVPRRYSLGASAQGFGPSSPVDLEVVRPPTADAERPEVRLELTSDGGSLVGVVTDPGGAPIAGAMVAAGAPPSDMQGMRFDGTMPEHWGARIAETGADGRYTLHGLAPGPLPLAALARGFPVAQHMVDVVAGTTTTRDVTLVPGASVAGVVRTADGAAVAGALVIQLAAPFVDPFPSQGPTDRGAPFTWPRTRSGADGRFVLGPLGPGEVHLYAAKGTSYWDEDGAVFLGTAQASLTARAGESLVWDPVLTLGLRIHGRVTFADGQPMKMVFVSARLSDAGDRGARRNAHTGDDGAFSITGLEDGDYTVEVQLWEQPPGSKPLRQTGVRPSESPLLLVADHDGPKTSAKATLRARIVDDAQRLGGRGTVLFDSDSVMYHPDLKDGVHSAEVAPGRYRARVLIGDLTVALSDFVEVGPGEVHDFGEVRTVAPASVVCRLTRGALAQEVDVSLRGVGLRSYASTALTGTDAQHTFADLLPGEYVLALWGMGVAHTMRTLSVRVGETLTVDLTLEAGVHRAIHIDPARPAGWGRFDVTVRGEDGAPRLTAEYDERWVTELPVVMEVMLPVGRFTVEARAADGRAARGELTLAAPSVASGESAPPLRIVLE